MTRSEFHNGLRILLNIDGDEFTSTGIDPLRWSAFATDPYRFFISCDDETCERLWSICEKRLAPAASIDRDAIFESVRARISDLHQKLLVDLVRAGRAEGLPDQEAIICAVEAGVTVFVDEFRFLLAFGGADRRVRNTATIGVARNVINQFEAEQTKRSMN